MHTQFAEETTRKLVQGALPKAMSYTQYRELVANLATTGRSTGPEQTDALTKYTQLNDRRMKRWEKILNFDESAVAGIKNADQKMTWLVLTESWCGDASPALPVLDKITELNPNISLQIILRDEHLELMNRFLTNGSRSIPKLIAIEDNTGEVFGDWGPRSTAATKLAEDYRSEHLELTPEFKEDLQVWYNRDRGLSVLADVLKIIQR